MIIAEIGINFDGSMELALELIRKAKENGANAVKFQLYKTEDLHPVGSKYYEIAKLNELSFEQAKKLFDYGESYGIEVFFSVNDKERVGWCEVIGVKKYKIAYHQKDNAQLIASIQIKKDLIISSDKPALGDFTLYCIPNYPTDIKDLQFDNIFPNFDGFSDHTVGLDAAKIALSRGAQIIEKHFCISRNGKKDNPDLAGSMTPDELKELVRFSKVVEQLL